MKESWLQRAWRRLFGPKEKPLARKRPRVRPASRGVEPLEGRIAPAVLLANGGLRYTDTDGDIVTITFSKQLFRRDELLDTTLQSVFIFSAGQAHSGAPNATDDVPQQLRLIDFTEVDTSITDVPRARGVSMKVSVQAGPNGDGLANIGAVDATDISLGNISVQGDLGQIDAGNDDIAIGLKSLKVVSLGVQTNTQVGAPTYTSTIIGQLGKFTADKVEGAYLHVVDGFTFSETPVSIGKIGTVVIHDYLKARNPNNAVANDGRIETDRGINFLSVGSGQATDGLTGGGGASSGTVAVGGGLGQAIIKGDLRGGTGAGSGSITVGGSIGSLRIDGSLRGSGANSATIDVEGSIASARISGSLAGGTGEGSAVISSGGAMGSIKVGILSGQGANTGGISADGRIGSVEVTGVVQGGTGFHSGFIESLADIGSVKLSDLKGGSGQRSGAVLAAGKIGTIDVTGQVLGASGVSSGGIFSGLSGAGGMGTVRIGHALTGGEGISSGVLSSGGGIASLTISGDDELVVKAGTGASSGSVYAFGAIARATIHGSVSGSIRETGVFGSLTVDGDLLGTIEALDNEDAEIAGGLGTIVIKGTIDGGTIRSAGAIASLQAAAVDDGNIFSGAGLLADGNVGTLSLGVVSGGSSLLFLGDVRTLKASSLGSSEVHVSGSLRDFALTGDLTQTTVTTGGSISTVTVGGDVQESSILAGYSIGGAAESGRVEIGMVRVGGGWQASDLVAGVRDVSGNGFGTADDALINAGGPALVSHIASVIITGAVSGAGQHGFVAQEIGSFRANGEALGLTKEAVTQSFALGSTTVREVPAI